MEQTGATVNTGGDPNAHAHGWNVHSHPTDTRHIHCDCTIGDCKLHAAAPALLEALEKIDETSTTRLALPSEQGDHLHLLSAIAALTIIGNEARKAIKEAK